MAGLRPLYNLGRIQSHILQFTSEREAKTLEVLKYVGEHFVKIARESGSYNDITGNLRSSIGYVIVKEGTVMDRNFQRAERGSDKSTGVKDGKAFAERLAQKYNKGFVLIGVAGMDYALFVEQIHQKDVITTAESKAKEMFKRLIEKME